ncbi:hypothetical protein [Nocardioides sp. Root151]|uniref:hypothetical protein n=1 Tax=Nocardioides sp. Root151 TaxID=1736475 RepID=UPI00070262A1|nr:hypothetical protein [Nocardioides sp. Root151]KQZ70157.1 hypothetical protein ASD66_10880 [Nocardioides sp. Root151]
MFESIEFRQPWQGILDICGQEIRPSGTGYRGPLGTHSTTPDQRTTAWFAALPLALDGIRIDHYLRQFMQHGIRQGHHEADS